MIVTYRWLKDYVDFDLPVDKLAEGPDAGRVRGRGNNARGAAITRAW